MHSPTRLVAPAVPQLLTSITEAQEVLEGAPSAGGDRRSNSLDSDGAESADGSEARARARAYSILGHVFFLDQPISQATLSVRVGDIGGVEQG